MPADAPTPPPVPPDAPRLLSVEEVEEGERLLTERDGCGNFDVADGLATGRALHLWLWGHRHDLLAAARLAATLQADQEQADAAMDALWETARQQGQAHDPTACSDGCGFCSLIVAVHVAKAAFRPLPVEDEEEPK